MSFLDKADMRNVVTLVMISMMVGSWIYFLSVVPIDQTKELDATLLVMIFANLIIGTLVGVFAWLGFKQGKTESATPQIQVPDGFVAETINGVLVFTKKP